MNGLRIGLLLFFLFFVIASPQLSFADDDVEKASKISFYHADQNKDGMVDEAEYAADAIAAFTIVDSDNDHKLEAHELKGADAEMIQRIDKNGDQVLDFKEVMANKMALYKEIDEDSDGVLSIDEVIEYNESQ